MKEILKCLAQPLRTEIILHLSQKGTATAKELIKEMDGVSQATLYRALSKLEQASIIEVITETKIRAVTEKTYSISKEYLEIQHSLLSNNDGGAYSRMFANFVMELAVEFENYSKRDNINLEQDGSGFSAVPIYATKEELVEYAEQIKKIIAPAMKKTSDKQRRHTFATVIAPPQDS